MRVVFIGASVFGMRCLEALDELDGITVAGAVTAPSTFSISYAKSGVTNVLHADVASFCDARAIPSAIIGDAAMRDVALLDTVTSWRPDAFLVAGWYHMVPRKWRALAPAYGLHASLLPDYSGGAPLVWAIIEGERRTGISLFQLADGVDNGPLVGQAATDIAESDTIATLYARIETLGVALIREHFPKLADGSAVFTVQDEAMRRVVPQRSPADGLIDWTWPARRIVDFVRAQTRPYPGAFTIIDGKKITIWECRVADDASPLAAGDVDRLPGAPRIGCGDGRSIELMSLALDDRDIAPSEWLPG